MINISIIIPAFNSEKYIERCIDSVLKQTSNNFEIIIVNDGSTDNTEYIIKEYSQRYSFIKQITQSNRGVSEARNRGLVEAKGEWIIFLDADDLLDYKACELVNKFNNEDIDIIFFDMININEESNIENITRDKVKVLEVSNDNKIELIKETIGFNSDEIKLKIPALKNVWAKAYRNTFLKENKILFPKGVKNGEDIIFNLKCLKHFNVGVFVNIPFYYYYYNQDSVSNRYKPDIDEITKMFYSELKLALGNSYRLREQIYLSIINNYFLEMNHYLFHKSNNVLRKQRIIEFKKRSSSEFYRSAFKNIKLLSIGRFFGMEKVIVAECIRLKAYGILYLLFEFKYILKKYKIKSRKK